MHLLDNDSFTRLKKRWEQLKDSPEVADPEIIEAIKLLNNVDGLVTIFSCQGHPNKEKFQDRGYIMFGVQDPTVLYRLFNEICSELNVVKHTIQLAMVNRMDVTVVHKEERWYPVWGLSWKIRLRNQKTVWKVINNAVKQVTSGLS